MRPFFSVCVAVYNGEDYLAKALESVKAQTFRDFELIVLDDGSNDASAEIAKRFDCRLLSQPNAGIGAARARLLSEATGEWVTFLDHDDWWKPEFLERMSQAAGQPGVVHAYSDAAVVDPEGTRLEFPLPAPLGPEALGHVIPQCFWNPCTVVSRQVLQEVGAFAPVLKACEDWRAWFLVASRGQISHVPEELVFVMRRPGSTSAPTRAYYEAERTVVMEILSRFSELYTNLPAERAGYYRRKLQEKLGLIISLLATTYDREGKRKSALPLHRQAITLAPRLKGVWYRYARSMLRLPV